MKRESRSRQALALLLAALLNVAWLFTLGCSAWCALGACPAQSAAAPEATCHHHSSSRPAPGHPGTNCPAHTYLSAAVVLKGEFHAPPRPRSLNDGPAPLILPVSARRTGTRPAGSLAHSPPRPSGRALCQHISLLRV